MPIVANRPSLAGTQAPAGREHRSASPGGLLVSILGEQTLEGYSTPLRGLSASALVTVNYVLGLAGMAALTFLIYGIFRYFAARGDENERKAASRMLGKSILSVAAVGLIAAFVNVVIADFIAPDIDVSGGGPLPEGR